MSLQPRPSVLRAKILAQHRDIEAMLAELEAAAERLVAGSSEDVGWVRKAADALGQVLDWHMTFEDRHLVPAIRDADGFGPVRAERLAEEHRSQRGALELLVHEVIDAKDKRAIAEHVRTFVDAIRADIVYEELTYVNDALLRDDPITSEFGG